jgi:CDP-6-deoxy-D-xylo-4-hexulose-3-dehydrase
MIGESMITDGDLVVPVSGKVIGFKERANVGEAMQQNVLTGGDYGRRFAGALANYLEVRHVSLCNSGSSANLLALAALTSPDLERPLKKGDSVIVAATSFPTTVAPIYQLGMTPIYVDVHPLTLNVEPSQVEKALKFNPKAIIIAHTLGNPFNVDKILEFCARNGVYLVEDNCDALGSEWRGRKTGKFGVFATHSFYPAHHITTGEGGAVASYNGRYAKILNSFRDWGRDCWCSPGSDGTCGRRFSQSLGDLPFGYDHKYIYSHLGYNMKMTEMQAAIGVGQMEMIDEFTKRRRRNFGFLFNALYDRYNPWLRLMWSFPSANASPFGFPITVRDTAPFTRHQLQDFLNYHGIHTRTIFGGNLTKQPAFRGRTYYKASDLKNADDIMENSLWVGCWHGLKKEHMFKIVHVIDKFMMESV